MRAIILVMAGLTFVGASGILQPRADAVSTPLKLLVYYGWPSVINRAADPAAAAAEFGRYDFVILGSGVEEPRHPDHLNTIAVLANPAMAGTFVFGYVTLGVNSDNLSLEEVRRRVDEWYAIGAEGIFFDEYGYDWGVSRERQNAAVDYVHSLGMPVLANAWYPADAFDSAAVPLANSDGLATSLGADDYYLFESYRIMSGDYGQEDLWRAKADQLAAYQALLGFSVMSVTTNGLANVYEQEKLVAAWEAAAADGHFAFGWGEYLFSIDGRAPYRTRPTLDEPPETTVPGTLVPGTTMPETTLLSSEGDGRGQPTGSNLAGVLCAKMEATIVGTPGDDMLVGTGGPDIIAGLGGDDTILGAGGPDLICGGPGRDAISGGPGDDRLGGGPGADWLSGDDGVDILRGGPGNDRLDGGDDGDRLVGGRGADELVGEGGDDLLFGKDGEDRLQGEGGFDRARGGPLTDGCNAERTFACET